MLAPEIYIIFFMISLIYSSVGFGGGSSYLAVMATAGIDIQVLRIVALLCNITVVTGGVYWFWKRKYLDWKKILPLTLLSMPLAYMGGGMQLTERIFFLIAGAALIVAGTLVLFQKYLVGQGDRSSSVALNAGVGGGIGFLSGLIGIGGGIFLSPFLHLIRWDKTKVIAGTASFFILVNSISGLAGQLSVRNQINDWRPILFLILTVFVGGQLGSRWGSGKLSPQTVRMITAVLVLLVGVRIVIKYF